MRTPDPTPEQVAEIYWRKEQEMQQLTPESCPYFSCDFIQAETQGETIVAICETIGVSKIGASNLVYGIKEHIASEAIEKPDVVFGAYPTQTQGESRWIAAETHFFVAKSGALCFRADAQNWALVEVPPDFYREVVEDDKPFLRFPFTQVRDEINRRNRKWGILPPVELRELLEQSAIDATLKAQTDILAIPEEIKKAIAKKSARAILPAVLSQPTFLEARQFANAISDGRDLRNWDTIQGAVALLHSPPYAKHGTRFEPNSLMLNWWGVSITEPQALYDELGRLDFDAVILFQVTLSAILHTEKARLSNISLDSIIKLIGRDTDARRSKKSREEWRYKVWRWLVIFDSMAVYGTRSGTWKEPGSNGDKREKMDEQALYSRDPLIRIVGTRDTEQGTFDGSAPPKEVSIVPGEWLMKFHGNREILSDMGNVLQIAEIARGKPSGAWAACAGLMLNQLWREEAARAERGRTSRGKETKTVVLKFRPFTRRELLGGTVRSDYDVNAVLSDSKNGHRARDYWVEAVKELQKRKIIGHYSELKSPPNNDWREEWLDQPLDIRPMAETLENALIIHDAAVEAKKRSKPCATKKSLPAPES